MTERQHASTTVLAAIAAAALVAPRTAAAQAQPSLAIDMSAFTSRNPFLVADDDSFTTGMNIAVSGNAPLQLDYATQMEVDAGIERREYGGRYGGFTSGHARLQLDARPSEYVSLHGEASFARTLPVVQFGQDIDGAIDPNSQEDRYELNEALTWHPDAHTSVIGRFGWTRLDPRDSTLLHSAQAFDISLAAQRQIDSLTTLGLQAGTTRSRSSADDDPRTWSLRITVNRRFAGHWRADMALGVNRNSRVSSSGRRESDPVQFAGSASLCNDPGEVSLCANAAVDTVVSGFGGLRRQTSLGMSLSWHLSEPGTLTARSDYVRSPTDDSRGNVSAISVSTRYEHRLDSRFSLFASADYQRRAEAATATYPANYGHLASLTFEVGITMRIPHS